MKLVNWQYCNDPNDINEAIKAKDEDWEGLTSANEIISITYDNNHGCYVVFWVMESSEKPRLIDPAYEKTLNKWIGAEVLDRIRNEMHATAEKHEDGAYYLRDEWVDEIIDKYAEEGKA